MQVLLINQNATIERLVKLSAGKLGYELTSAKDIVEVENGKYNFIIIDSDLYNEDEFAALKQKFDNAKYLLIVNKGIDRPDGFDIYVEKPFLPTELVDILSSNASTAEMGDENIFEDVSAFESSDVAADINDSGNDEFLGLDETDFGIEDAPKDELNELEELSFGEETPIEQLDEIDNIDISSDKDDDLSALDDLDMPQDLDAEEPAQINLDDQIGAAMDEANEIDFDADDSELELDAIGDLGAELDRDLLADENLKMPEDISNEIESPDLMGIDEIGEDELEGLDLGEKDEEDGQIFDEDEVNKLKNLLDETEEEGGGAEDFDLQNIKIQNDELGSLTEESLAEALGVNVDTGSSKDDMLSSDGDDLDGIDGGLPDSLPMPAAESPSQSAATNIPTSAIQLNPNQSITISLDALKELLNMADVTINITLSKKQ